MTDIYDELAEEAVGWFSGWILPGRFEATPHDLEMVQKDIARVFRQGLSGANGVKP